MSNVFIDKFDSDDCSNGGQHDWSETVLTFKTRKGEERYINQEHYLKNRKQYQRMRITCGQGRCSKCKIPYMLAHNPNFIGDE